MSATLNTLEFEGSRVRKISCDSMITKMPTRSIRPAIRRTWAIHDPVSSKSPKITQVAKNPVVIGTILKKVQQ